jgi:branched-chain amino acid transport system permease protein
MINALLSGDLPRSRLLSAVLVLILATLAAAPLLFPGAQAINTAAKICVFVVLVASYDLLLGYTGMATPAWLHRHRVLCTHHGLRARRLWSGACPLQLGSDVGLSAGGLAIALVAGVALAS